MKEEFIKLLKETNREGMDKLIEFLENSDFFEAPASTRYHGNFKGGLVEHSMKVYEILKTKVEDMILLKLLHYYMIYVKQTFIKQISEM